MANAKRLPSGSWRTHATKVINGKRISKSFTVSPDDTKGDWRKAKSLSEKMAREWQISQDALRINGKTVRMALDDYINERSKVLSPSTITNYKRLLPYFEPIADLFVDDLKSSDVQPLVNEWSVSVSAKTIKNRIGLLLPALDYADFDRKLKLRFPRTASKEIKSPDLEHVQMLLRNAPDEFKPVLYLAAFGGLRRGEIPALKQKDILRDLSSVYVHADMVLDDHSWVYKPFTKNGQSGTVRLPKFIIDLIPQGEDPEAFVFDMNPNMLSKQYDKLRFSLGLIDYNFHSLRHFAASFRSDLGIPRKYIEEDCRWESGSGALERIYDNTLDSSRKKYHQIVNDYIEENFKSIG